MEIKLNIDDNSVKISITYKGIEKTVNLNSDMIGLATSCGMGFKIIAGDILKEFNIELNEDEAVDFNNKLKIILKIFDSLWK